MISDAVKSQSFQIPTVPLPAGYPLCPLSGLEGLHLRERQKRKCSIKTLNTSPKSLQLHMLCPVHGQYALLISFYTAFGFFSVEKSWQLMYYCFVCWQIKAVISFYICTHPAQVGALKLWQLRPLNKLPKWQVRVFAAGPHFLKDFNVTHKWDKFQFPNLCFRA